MASADIEQQDIRKPMLVPIVIGLVLAVALGGGGFAAIRLGVVEIPAKSASDSSHAPVAVDVGFVSLDPILVSLPLGGNARHLRFRAQLEVEPYAQAEVAALTPRILDVMNGYLRAVEVKDLEQPTALIRLRAQLLRRIQLVVGNGKVRDLLVAEFVIN